MLWFFILGEAMGIAAIIPNWSKGWPHWYWLSWLITWPIVAGSDYCLRSAKRRLLPLSCYTRASSDQNDAEILWTPRRAPTDREPGGLRDRQTLKARVRYPRLVFTGRLASGEAFRC